MAAKMTIQTRTQLPVYTAETLAAKNPVLLKGEIVYESDTGRHKLGDGTTAWNTLAYASDVEKVPALRWKVQGGMLYVKPATDPADPILKRCSVGILHYKNARVRKSSAAKLRPTSGWLPVISVEALFGRWVTRISDTSYCGKVKFDLHRGINICGRGAGQDEFGKLKMYVSFYSGVVLFVGDAQRRIEGPRSYFKVAASNCGLTPSVLHI